jgi:Prenyltransferase and squalene oxidase repeat
MMRWMPRLVLAVVLAAAGTPAVRAEEIPEKVRPVVAHGLEWLAKAQFKDGHWEGNGGQFASAMTGIAGTTLLMEGSTLREGKYKDNIRKAVDWLTDRTQRNGLIGDPNASNQGLGYLYGHGFSILFLSQIYGEEDDVERRKKLEDVLTRAVEFTCRSQTSRGGWGYVSAKEGNDFDEGSVSITQVQALRAARNAGISVPKEAIDKTQEYLRKCTTPNGGLIYSLANGGGPERPTITVAAIAALFSTGEYTSPLARQWLKFVQPQIPINSVGADQFGHSEYTHYYYGQVAYVLGEDGYAKMFPNSKPEERLTWSKYRTGMFEFLANKQNKDGSWTGTPIGQVYTTSCYLTILQLDKGVLPIYQR